MKNIVITKEGYGGIPADKEAFVSCDDLESWAETKDAELIPQVIATIKGLKGLTDTTAVTPRVATLTIKAGEKKDVAIDVTPVYSGSAVAWASADTTKATVEQNGNNPNKATIKAVAAGTVNITATANSHVGTIAVTIEA